MCRFLSATKSMNNTSSVQGARSAARAFPFSSRRICSARGGSGIAGDTKLLGRREQFTQQRIRDHIRRSLIEDGLFRQVFGNPFPTQFTVAFQPVMLA